MFNRPSSKAGQADSTPELIGLAQKTRYVANRLQEISIALDARDMKLAVERKLKLSTLPPGSGKESWTVPFKTGQAQNKP